MHDDTPRASLDRLRSEVDVLRASRRRLVVAGDADRHAIEREFHRGVQQHLVALSVNLQLAARRVESDPEGAKAALDEMRRDVEQALGEAAELAERIHPPLLDAGLAVALRAAVAALGYPVAVDVDAIPGCPPEIALSVLLCCLQPLGAQGAGPPASVTVRRNGRDVAMEVVVTGSASDAYDALCDRVEALDGRLSVDHDADATTRLTASLPLLR